MRRVNKNRAEKKNCLAFHLAAIALLLLPPAAAWSQQVRVEGKPKLLRNGRSTQPFDVTRHSIPLSEIQGGGPPRDGIPALNDPQNMTAEQAARLLGSSERILGVVFNGRAKAYPIRILNYHELVNDTVGEKPILVSW